MVAWGEPVDHIPKPCLHSLNITSCMCLNGQEPHAANLSSSGHSGIQLKV